MSIFQRMTTMDKIFIFGFGIILAASYGNQEYCPKMCDCDVINDLNRADCSNQKLISAQIDMPKQVEILDLRQNDIAELDDESFRDLKQLRALLLANNSISTIHIDAFEKLKKLEVLDLSYNRLSVFDDKIIENNHNLITVKLRGNKFMNLEDDPILKSQALQNLDLHNSQLSQVSSSLFKNLPNLKYLDLSNNLLITLEKDVFKHNKKLKKLILKNNPWNCDTNLENTLKWLKRRHVDIEILECALPRSKPMFERMQMDPSHKPTETPKKDNIDIEKVWKINKDLIKDTSNEMCPLDDIEKACDMYESCMSKYSSFLKDVQYKLEYANKLRKKQWERFLGIEFYIGLICGSFLGGTIIYLCTLCCNGNRKSKRRNRTYSPDYDSDGPRIATITTPIDDNQERSRTRRTQRMDRIRTEIPQIEEPSFFARLFQRPARRRYYSAINQNATNLVRRLSQSRLFLNTSRMNSHDVATRNDANATNSTSDVTRLIENSGSESHINVERIYPSAPLEDLTRQIDSTDTHDDLPSRPETPPPAYIDIIPKSSK